MQKTIFALASFLLIGTPALAQEAPVEEQTAPAPATEPAPQAATEPAPAPQAEAADEAPETPTGMAAEATEPADRYVVTPEQLESERLDLQALLQDERQMFELDGYYRVRANYLNGVGVFVPETDDINRFFRHRLRFEPRFNLNDKVVFKAQVDALDDQVWGSNPGNVLAQSTADDTSNLIVKRAWAEVTLPFGRLDVGRMPSHWGMGLLSNDGNGFRNIFGDAHNGTTLDRVLFATKPLGPDSNWILALVYDKIVANEPIVGQTPTSTIPGQGVGGLRGVDPANAVSVDEAVGVLAFNTDPLKLGVYQLVRWEGEQAPGSGGRVDIQGRPVEVDTLVYATDFHFKIDLGLLYAETEQLWLYGHTNGVPVLRQRGAQLAPDYQTADLSARGYAARVGLAMEPYGFEFEWGRASGDRNRVDDGEFTSFSFSPDYNVGLIMFEYAADSLSRQLTAGTLDGLERLQDQGLVAEETVARMREISGLAITNGSVSNAFYLNPKLQFKFFDSKLQTTLAYLWAKADQSRIIRQGGTETRLDGMGHEVDLDVRYEFRKDLLLGVQGGWFTPGEYFDRQDIISGDLISPEGDAWLVQGRFTVLF